MRATHASEAPDARAAVRVVGEFCHHSRESVLEMITASVGRHAGPELHDLILDYPLRPAKGLRPALCIATCRALGGTEEAALPSAAALELLHNAFLIHDDVEDGSLDRRGGPTLQRDQGTAAAINVGDGLMGLALQPLLTNTKVVGLGPALRVLERVWEMVMITVKGQAMELAWTRDNVWTFGDAGYVESYEQLVRAKTADYSFVAPVELGWLLAGGAEHLRAPLVRGAEHLGIAFQIVDDILNLQRANESYGKEIAGDLWEGKRTLILLHALHEASPTERSEALKSLAKPRVTTAGIHSAQATGALEELYVDGRIDTHAYRSLSAALGITSVRTVEDVEALLRLIESHRSIEFARRIARSHIELADAAFAACEASLAPGEASSFLSAVRRYVLERLR